jgi:hypothetical protein
MQAKPQRTPQTLNEIIEQLTVDIDTGQKCRCTLFWQPDRGDSILEQHFWHYLRKTEMGWHGAIDQFEIGQFRVDCLIDCGGQTVVVELDGKRYHKADEDELRDKEILQYVDAIVRIPFAAMWHYAYGTFEVLGQWFPRLALRAQSHWVLSIEDYKEELRKLPDDPVERRMFYDDSEHDYHVWERDGDMAIVGSPSGFGWSAKMHRVWVRRGNHDPRILDQLYERTGCNRTVPIGSE